jgi:hypothetical protein
MPVSERKGKSVQVRQIVADGKHVYGVQGLNLREKEGEFKSTPVNIGDETAPNVIPLYLIRPRYVRLRVNRLLGTPKTMAYLINGDYTYLCSTEWFEVT